MSETIRPTPEARQKAVDALSEAFARDEIEVGELETRLELVHRAETAEQLGIILADLPPAPVPVKRDAAASRVPMLTSSPPQSTMRS